MAFGVGVWSWTFGRFVLELVGLWDRPFGTVKIASDFLRTPRRPVQRRVALEPNRRSSLGVAQN